VIGSWGSWNQRSGIEGGIQVHRLSAGIGSTSWAASVNGSERISGSLVADFTVQVINNTVTAFRQSAIRSAGVGSCNVARGSVVAFLASISDIIPTLGQLAVGSAAGRFGIGIARSVVADFTWVDTAISTFLLATRITTITIGLISIVASFSSGGISNTITTVGHSTPRATGIGFVFVACAIVTFLKVIKDTIAAVPQETVGSASIWNLIAVVNSIIALLSVIQNAVSANNLAAFAMT